jgi:hypothetical protein
MPAHKRQRIARCDQHLFPPRAGLIAQLSRLNGSLLPFADQPARADISASRSI